MRVAPADVVLIAHFLFAAFVVAGFALILIGARRWHWVRSRKFRIAHFGAIVLVAAESVLGITCPLTAWEDFLRGSAGQQPGFVSRWVGRLLYYDFPEWVFALVYIALVAAAAWAWRMIPPRRSSEARR